MFWPKKYEFFFLSSWFLWTGTFFRHSVLPEKTGVSFFFGPILCFFLKRSFFLPQCLALKMCKFHLFLEPIHFWHPLHEKMSFVRGELTLFFEPRFFLHKFWPEKMSSSLLNSYFGFDPAYFGNPLIFWHNLEPFWGTKIFLSRALFHEQNVRIS